MVQLNKTCSTMLVRVMDEEDLPMSKESTPSQKTFGLYIKKITPANSTDLEQIGLIQESARIFNETRGDKDKISLLFHFTDDKGAKGISTSESIGGDEERTYLTEISPDVAQPLMQPDDAKEFEAFVKGEKMPERLQDDIRRFILSMKYRWTYGVKKKILGKPIIPIGEHKLKHVVLLAKPEKLELERDENDEIYIERKINLINDDQFESFGPFKTS